MNEAEARKLKAQQEANSAAIARMQMMMQAQNARRDQNEPLEEEEPMQRQQPPQQPQYQQPYQPQQPQPNMPYQGMDHNQLMLQAITNQAARAASQQVKQDLTASNDLESKIKTRMKRLVEDYPALTEEDSPLVVESRKSYARIAHENPGLDDATKYELAVREAASTIGARPVSAPVDILASDFVMPAGRNPALPTRSTKSRLTPAIIANAKLMGINVDPNSAEGQKNLSELSEYSGRFNADQDESQYRYK